MPLIDARNICRILLLSCTVFCAASSAADSGCAGESSAAQQQRDILKVNLAGIGVITAYGIAEWDYFSSSPQAKSEGWFGNDTKSGGADKLGHLYTSYVTTHGLSYLYESWCINRDDAALYGAWSSLAILGYMEVGDAFSDWGFSKEDLVANAAGVVLGYYLYTRPEWASKLDLRWEYGFDPSGDDFVTDYENSKYLLALKLNGFDYFRESFFRHIELYAGYYTRGFDDPLDSRERHVFVGIGINLTDLFGRHGYRKTATVLRYFQLPGTSVEFDRDINQ